MSSLVNLDRILRQAVESKAMPGIVAVAATGTGILYEGAFGTRELGTNAPMTLDTVVWIASRRPDRFLSAAAAQDEEVLVRQERSSGHQP